MKGIFHRIEKIHQKTEGAVVFLSGLIVIAMLTLICSEVILRNIFNISIPGIFEISSQMMVAISFLGISYVQQKREHISVDLISEKVPLFVNKVMNILIFMIGILITAIYSWQGWISFYDSWEINEYTLGIVQVPLWPGKLVVALSMMFIAFRYFLDLIVELASFKSTEEYIPVDQENSSL